MRDGKETVLSRAEFIRMKVTDNMLEILKSGGSFKFQGWIVNAARPRLPRETSRRGLMLFSLSPNGEALQMPFGSWEYLRDVVERMFQEINSRSYLPESAYRNGIRLDTEYRCQNFRKCNPDPKGKSRLLFVSAGKVNQVIQIKCKCGYMNTFWRNRIKLDASGALKMETA